MLKRTEGPWTADGPIICGAGTTQDVEGCSIASMMRPIRDGSYCRHLSADEQEGNKSLILAAPNLLAMLRVIVLCDDPNEVARVMLDASALIERLDA